MNKMTKSERERESDKKFEAIAITSMTVVISTLGSAVARASAEKKKTGLNSPTVAAIAYGGFVIAMWLVGRAIQKRNERKYNKTGIVLNA